MTKNHSALERVFIPAMASHPRGPQPDIRFITAVGILIYARRVRAVGRWGQRRFYGAR